MFAVSLRALVSCLQAILAALWYSLRRMVRWGDHPRLEWWEERELVVCSFRGPVSRSSVPPTQPPRTFREGQGGGGGTMKFLTVGDSRSQCVWSHLRHRGAASEDGNARYMMMETSSKPVEGREVSQLLTKGITRGLAKARSMTEVCAFPERENLVYTSGVFIGAKPPSATNSKYGAQEETSWDDMERSGSAKGLWKFRSPTTKSGIPVSGKRYSGGTE